MPKLHFLMLEDDPTDVELISTTLLNSDLDCKFSVVETRESFQATIKTQPIDLVLADYSLPGFDGLTAIQMVQNVCPEVPCILISGVLGEELAIESLKSGATDYVLKQRLERLPPVVKRALREKQERLELANTTAALRKSEERFRTSVETMVDCFAILSTIRNSTGSIQDFVISYLNDAACQYLSVSHSNQIGNTVYAVIPGLKNTASTDIFSAYRWVVETGRPFQEEIILQGQHNPEQFVALDMRAAKLGDGLVVTWRDITERKQVEQQRTQLLQAAEAARNQAEQANRTKDEFLANLSHELRTPLNSINGWLQLVLSDKLKPEMITKALNTVHHNAKLLEQLINDILDVSRIVQGRFYLNSQPLSLTRINALITTSIDTIMPAARAKSLQITFTPCQLSGKISGDPDRLQQVMWNLLSNAVKFTPNRGQILITLALQEHSAVISIEDTGSGIDPDLLPSIFERFQQANQSPVGTQGGLGLGLSIVRYIVESHGGRIEADSAGIDQGSTFRVYLPLSLPEEQPMVQAVTYPFLSEEVPPSPSDLNISLRGIRVLVVEDIKDARDVYLLMLQEYHADVMGAASAAEAFEIFPQFLPHVLISDISMPEEDGYSLIRKIRSLPTEQGGNVPAVALTAYTQARDRTRALLAGFQLYIPKPIDLNELVTVVFTLSQRNKDEL